MSVFVPTHGQVHLGTLKDEDQPQPRLYTTDTNWRFIGKAAAQLFEQTGELSCSVALHAVTHGYVVRRTCWRHENYLQHDPATNQIMKYRHPVWAGVHLKLLGWQPWLPTPEDLMAKDWSIRYVAYPDIDFKKALA